MKKYPFSNKAMKAILAASIALSPFAASAAFSTPVQVEAATPDQAIERVKLIYSKLSTPAVKAFNDAATGLNGFTNQDWTNILTPQIEDHINNKLDGNVKAADIAKKLSNLVYSANNTDLSSKLNAFKISAEGIAFETAMEMNGQAIDTILEFLVDAEKEMWKKGFAEILSQLENDGIESITKDVRDELIKQPKYDTLNSKLYTNLGTNLDGLIDIKDRVNSKLVDKGAITSAQFKVLKNAFIGAALDAGRPSDGSNSGGGAVTNPGEDKIELPNGSTNVVEEGNNVVTEVSEAKVQEIVNLITAEKSVVEIPLEKVSGDKQAKAQIPASLFTEASKKNSNAVVAIKTDAAVYKLPVSEINVAELAKKLGVASGDVKINISVNVVSADVKNSVSNVVEFHILAVSGDKQEAVTAFSTYVERVLAGTKDFSKGNSVAVKLNADGSFTSIPTFFDGKNATVKSLTNSKYTVIENNVTFKDVTSKGKDYWAKEYIETLASKLIVKGKEEGKYVPADHMTRAEFTVLLVRALGLPAEKYDGNFKDVKGTEWFNANGEIMAAVKHGLIEGMDNGTFAPKEKITRAQAAVMIDRAMNLKYVGYDMKQLDSKKTAADFKDASKFKAWNKKAIEAVYQADIVSGRDTKEFDPNGFTKRDEMAKIISEFLTSAKLMN